MAKSFEPVPAKITDYGNAEIIIGCLLQIPLVFIVVLIVEIVPPGSFSNWGDLAIVTLMFMIFGALPGLPGLYFIRKGRRGKRLKAKLEIYLPLVVKGEMRGIDHIAAKLGLSDSDIVMRDVQQLIDYKLLPGVVFDRELRLLIDVRG